MTTRLKAAAERTGKTQQAMAAELAVTETHLNKLLNGAVQPSFELALKLAGYFRQPIGSLWELTEVGIVARECQDRRR